MNPDVGKSFRIIRGFSYKGYKCVVIQNLPFKYLLGYVKLPKGHKYYGVPKEAIPVDCHGELTYGEIEGDYYVIGFDCAHFGDLDIDIPENTSSSGRNITDWFKPNKDENFVTDNIKSIVDQLEKR